MKKSLQYQNRAISNTVTMINKKEHVFATILVFDNSNIPQVDAGNVLVREFHIAVMPDEEGKQYQWRMHQNNNEKTNHMIVKEQIEDLEKRGFTIA